MKKHGVDLNVDLEALQAEYEQLQTSHAEYTGQLAAVQEELKPLKEIRYWVSKVLDPEQAEVKRSRSRSTLSPNRFRIIGKNPEKGRAAPAGEKQNMEL